MRNLLLDLVVGELQLHRVAELGKERLQILSVAMPHDIP